MCHEYVFVFRMILRLTSYFSHKSTNFSVLVMEFQFVYCDVRTDCLKVFFFALAFFFTNLASFTELVIKLHKSRSTQRFISYDMQSIITTWRTREIVELFCTSAFCFPFLKRCMAIDVKICNF
jgi:hypothetical protein